MKKTGLIFFYWLGLLLATMSLFSCRKSSEEFITSGGESLSFSKDSLYFDTLFSTVGSATQRLIVRNPNKNAVRIQHIYLGGGDNSPYDLIINGQVSNAVENLEILGKDSIYILVKVLIDPQSQTLPYLVEDSIVFSWNNKVQQVPLLAHGQDANFYVNTSVACNTTWNDPKPYVLYGKVMVPAGCTLTLAKGVTVYVHPEASMEIAGTLLTQGTKDSLVRFQTDRLDNSFKNLPGQWEGLLFKNTSTGNQLLYTQINNAVHGIRVEANADGDTLAELSLGQCVIKNCSKEALEAGPADIYLYNSLLYNSPYHLVKMSTGGNFYADYCTFANYSYDFFRETEALYFSNIGNDFKGQFRNCIVWGDKTSELTLVNNPVQTWTIGVHSCHLKTSASLAGNGNQLNTDPLFVNPVLDQFALQATSTARNNAVTLPGISQDLAGSIRNMVNPDRGAYEE